MPLFLDTRGNLILADESDMHSTDKTVNPEYLERLKKYAEENMCDYDSFLNPVDLMYHVHRHYNLTMASEHEFDGCDWINDEGEECPGWSPDYADSQGYDRNRCECGNRKYSLNASRRELTDFEHFNLDSDTFFGYPEPA